MSAEVPAVTGAGVGAPPPLHVTACSHPEVLLLEAARPADARGFFEEIYNEQTFARATGLSVRFVQDNRSHSRHGVLRGLHYQCVAPQGKLVCVLAGRVFDVAVDLRPDSPRRGHWVAVELDARVPRRLWIPPGFAHGFLVLSRSAEVFYKTTALRAPEAERALAWNDPQLAIPWPLTALRCAPRLSGRDAQAPGWDSLETPDVPASAPS